MFMLRSATYLLKIWSSDLKSAYNLVTYSIKYTKVEMQISETAKVIFEALLNPWEWKSSFENPSFVTALQ